MDMLAFPRLRAGTFIETSEKIADRSPYTNDFSAFG